MSIEERLEALEKDVLEIKKRLDEDRVLTDSLSIGTDAKGGSIKIYHTAKDPEGFKSKVDNMFEVRQHAQMKMNEGSL